MDEIFKETVEKLEALKEEGDVDGEKAEEEITVLISTLPG